MNIAKAATPLIALAMSFHGSAVLAQTGAAEALPRAGAEGYPSNLYYVATPDALIRQGVDQLRGFVAARADAPPDEVLSFVTQQIAPYFDFQYMAQWAAGPLYDRLNEAQRFALSARLAELLMDALARQLGAIERPFPQVDVFPARPGRSMTDAVVFARVLSPQMQSRLEFRFYWNGYQWKVYDAAANGSSAVAYYRRYFTAMLRRYGPDALLRP